MTEKPITRMSLPATAEPGGYSIFMHLSRRILSLLLAVLMTAVPVSAASSETRYVVPSEVQNTYTKGAYQVSIESSTRTLYYESRGGIADGVSWAFGPLCFVSRVNRSIMLLSGEPAIFYAMADVFRFGRVTSLILSDSGEVQEKYTFTRDPERNLVTKVEEETPSASVTYNISYDRSSTIHSIARERRGRPVERDVYHFSGENAVSVSKQRNGKTVSCKVETNSKGLPLSCGGVRYDYNSDGYPTKISYEESGYRYSLDFTYYSEQHLLKSAVQKDNADGRSHTRSYSYHYAHLG